MRKFNLITDGIHSKLIKLIENGNNLLKINYFKNKIVRKMWDRGHKIHTCEHLT